MCHDPKWSWVKSVPQYAAMKTAYQGLEAVMPEFFKEFTMKDSKTLNGQYNEADLIAKMNSLASSMDPEIVNLQACVKRVQGMQTAAAA